MFGRSALERLREWKNSPHRKPLVIRGARQVGKSTLIDEFGKEFGTYIHLNLDRAEDLALFEKELPVNELFEVILALKGKRKDMEDTLIFIDEIQNSATAIKSLRYFYEELPQLHVISAGSLLETMLNRGASFPVGRVEYLALRPCSFQEFLGAVGQTALQEMVNSVRVPEALHSKVMSLFNRYSIIGGMPEVVAHYAEHHDLVALDNIYDSLLAGYSDDVEKYETRKDAREVLRFLISGAWGYASERISFERFGGSHYKSREIGDAFRTLQKTMLLELAYPTTSPSLPLLPDLSKKPKLLFLDTGIVNHVAGIRSELLSKEDILDGWRGRTAEHIIGQELFSQSTSVLDRRTFWVREARNSQAEIDWLYSSRAYGLVPIEVKSGHSGKLRSLHAFMEESPCSLALRFWNQPLSSDTVKLPSGKSYRLYNAPYYYAGQVEKLLKAII